MIHRIWKKLWTIVPLILIALAGCEGDGTGGDGLVIRPDPEGVCGSTGGFFPSGIAMLSPGQGVGRWRYPDLPLAPRPL